MENNKSFFWGISASIFLTIATLLMLFQNTINAGITLLIIGAVVAVFSFKEKTTFKATYLYTAIVLSIIIITYTSLITYSKNLIIISTSFYALNFLIQLMPEKTKKKKLRIKETIKELKEELKKEKQQKTTQKTYFTTKNGKSFHLPGCIALSRTKQEKLTKNNSREKLIEQGYKTCKACNS